MKNRKHPLRLWLLSNGKTLAEFAVEIGASPTYLSEVITKRRKPSLDYVDRIRRGTRGAIKAEHF